VGRRLNEASPETPVRMGRVPSNARSGVDSVSPSGATLGSEAATERDWQCIRKAVLAVYR